MSLLDSASFCVTPNGYNKDKLYSVIPNTTLGDMDVVRATSATRVNSAGLIEIARTNLVLRSEEFDNVYWGKTNTVITANSIISPNGSQNADLISYNSTTNILSFITTNAINSSYTISVFAKKGTGSVLRIREIYHFGTASTFDLNAGTVLTGTGKIENYGNGWYRCSITQAYTNLQTSINWSFDSNSNINNLYLWGAQVEAGETATEYIPTVALIRTKFAGITQDGGIALNIPRIDYPPLGGCPRILVESERKNEVTYSEQFNNVSWLKYFATVTSNSQQAPDGNITADLVYPSTTGGLTGQVYRTILTGITSGNVVTVSVFVKASGKNFAYISPVYNYSPGAWFNLTTGAITNPIANVTTSMTDFGDGWWRISLTSTSTSSTSNAVAIGSTDATNSSTNTASGTNGILVWGAQVEVGTTATSYIPTVASTITRNADVISKTGVSSLIGQPNGTIFIEANLTANTEQRRIITIGTEFQRIMFWTSGTTLRANFNGESITIGTFPIGTAKMALGYTIGASSTTYSIKLNNNTLITGTAAAAPSSLSAIYLGSSANGTLILNDRIESATLFLTRLTDPQLATLTAI